MFGGQSPPVFCTRKKRVALLRVLKGEFLPFMGSKGNALVRGIAFPRQGCRVIYQDAFLQKGVLINPLPHAINRLGNVVNKWLIA